MNKAAIFFANGYEEVEAIAVVDLLRREEIETLMVSVSNELLVESARGIVIQMDDIITQIDFNTIDMIILPGGLNGTKGLEACDILMKELDRFHELKKGIAAICAAPRILGQRGILEGISACCYPAFESHLSGAKILKEAAVRDGHIITSRGMGTSIDFALAIVKYFKGEKAAENLAETIIWCHSEQSEES